MMLLRRVAVLYPPRSAMFFCSKTSNEVYSAVDELNKEMEAVFGEPPTTRHSGSISNFIAQEAPPPVSRREASSEPGLTHVGNKGEAEMVDVSHKASSYRTATASCKVILGKKVFELVSADQMGKGDVLSVAKIAGITGAKQTSSLIPLCHNINLTHVGVELRLNPKEYSVEIEGEAATRGETGVEMEAMTAVCVAGLTVYDMCKAASKNIKMTSVQLNGKTGGKSGKWIRGEE